MVLLASEWVKNQGVLCQVFQLRKEHWIQFQSLSLSPPLSWVWFAPCCLQPMLPPFVCLHLPPKVSGNFASRAPLTCRGRHVQKGVHLEGPVDLIHELTGYGSVDTKPLCITGHVCVLCANKKSCLWELTPTWGVSRWIFFPLRNQGTEVLAWEKPTWIGEQEQSNLFIFVSSKEFLLPVVQSSLLLERVADTRYQLEIPAHSAGRLTSKQITAYFCLRPYYRHI